MGIQIEKMQIEDLNQINLDEFDDFWTNGILQNELLSSSTYYIVAKSDSDILGFAGLNFILDEAHIANIVVKKVNRNNKIGSMLLENLLTIASKESSLITLEVNENNLPAIHLYEKYGFQYVGRRKKYYKNTYDALIMTKYFSI